MNIHKQFEQISDTIWQIPPSYKSGMRVPVRIFASKKLLSEMEDGVVDQITNVAMLPGIVGYASCMPDGHWGYGFPIGGTAAVDAEEGVISPGGIGFDINCGMRLLRTNLTFDDVQPKLEQLVNKLYRRVPAGVGGKSPVKMSRDEFCQVIEEGARWCVRKGYGWKEDLDKTEHRGCIFGANSSKVSQKAIDRGFRQVGTLGSGNHYLEIQVAREHDIFNQPLARTFGIDRPDQVVIMFHCGSRGFGHQVATDYLQKFSRIMGSTYGISLPDRELSCVPLQSPEGQDYFAAMNCAINMSYANRQIIAHLIREVFADVFDTSAHDLGMHQVYDVSHNTAMLETHQLDGQERRLLVHRKGATRAFGPGNTELPKDYREAGQPVIIGGSMETGSWLLAGIESGEKTFFTTAHGSGRIMSRSQAKKQFRGEKLMQEMRHRGIYVRCVSHAGLAEEAGGAYKNVDEVIKSTEDAGISRRVVRFTPIGNVKG